MFDHQTFRSIIELHKAHFHINHAHHPHTRHFYPLSDVILKMPLYYIFSKYYKCVYRRLPQCHHHRHNCKQRFQCFLQQLLISPKQFFNTANSNRESLSPDNSGPGLEHILLAQINKRGWGGCSKNVLVCIF